MDARGFLISGSSFPAHVSRFLTHLRVSWWFTGSHRFSGLNGKKGRDLTSLHLSPCCRSCALALPQAEDHLDIIGGHSVQREACTRRSSFKWLAHLRCDDGVVYPIHSPLQVFLQAAGEQIKGHVQVPYLRVAHHAHHNLPVLHRYLVLDTRAQVYLHE